LPEVSAPEGGHKRRVYGAGFFSKIFFEPFFPAFAQSLFEVTKFENLQTAWVLVNSGAQTRGFAICFGVDAET